MKECSALVEYNASLIVFRKTKLLSFDTEIEKQ